jgi:hypothetical protein
MVKKRLKNTQKTAKKCPQNDQKRAKKERKNA